LAPRPPSRSSEEFIEALREGEKGIGILLDREKEEALVRYFLELEKWNAKKNLTSLQDPKEIAIKHFVDSLTLLPLLKKEDRILDIGTGAGFPGLVLKIAKDDLRVTLLEASFKKVAFLKHLKRVLKLEGLEVIHGRAEDPELVEKEKERFSVVVSRALGALGDFLKLALPYLFKGGRAIAMKGPKGGLELEGLELVSFNFKERLELELPFRMGKRLILVFEKK
jgi:16S rRNA (guanine527-N7)-methyltransferase